VTYRRARRHGTRAEPDGAMASRQQQGIELQMSLLNQLQAALIDQAANPPSNQGALLDSPTIAIIGDEQLPAWFDVTGLASASLASAAAALVRYATATTGDSTLATNAASITVDQRLASLWFGWSLRPQRWQLPAAWDELAGDYETRDGWIKLHTNARHHKAAVLRVMGSAMAHAVRQTITRADLAAAVATWSGGELEDAIVAAGGCAAVLRTQQQWLALEQGQAVQQEPLIHWRTVGQTQGATAVSDQPGKMALGSTAGITRPLQGIRVLDLTRVLAGPVAGRFLAGYGAEVLRIDPPDWEEPGVVPEVTLGKRCAGLDLTAPQDRERFETLLRGADLLLHGYRADALANLGYDREALSAINPNLIDICLNAYGWTGPWKHRRGFDSLVQMSTGIAAHGMARKGARSNGKRTPTPLPVQALDHATGYVLAAATLQALDARTHGVVKSAKTSLARVATLLQTTQRDERGAGLSAETSADIAPAIERTAWGDAQRVRWPIQIATTAGPIDAHWPTAAGKLRSSPAAWIST